MSEKNFFDIEQEFFLIDSEHLDEVKTRFYGYSVQRSGIYEEDNLTEKAIAGLDGRGCYVYVEVKDGHISIRQDSCGCYGIYMFRQGEYFALSNSFYRLLHHVSQKYPLTVNKDYANHFLVNGLSSVSPQMTPVREISILDRWAILNIDVDSRSIEVNTATYKELCLSLDTSEGIAALDDWFDFWTGFLKNISEKTNSIRVDLSGGYDSRLTFLLMLCAGVDLNKILVYSNNDGLHTHVEDYAIASEIADYYGFSLNVPLPKTKWLNYSLEDSLNIERYIKLGFHKEPYFKTHIPMDKTYAVMGAAGEAIRERYTIAAEEFVEEQMPIETRYATLLRNDIYKSIDKVVKEGYKLVEQKYGKPDKSSGYPQFMHRDGITRSHFGKIVVVNYFSGITTLTPLMDPVLWKLRLNTGECDNYNLLMALIYVRYCPNLMKFRFEGNHYFMSKETVEAAKKINSRFERNKRNVGHDESFVLQSRNKKVIEAFDNNFQNKAHSVEEVHALFKSAFDSAKVKGLFMTHFDEQFYDEAVRYYSWSKFFPLRHCTGILAMAQTIKMVLASQVNENWHKHKNLFSIIAPFENKYQNRKAALNRFKNYITARLDFKLYGTTDADKLNIVSIDDDLARWSKPSWFQKSGGVGIMLHSSCGKLTVSLECLSDGKLHMWLRGVDIRQPGNANKRVPYWIKYNEFAINGKLIFLDDHPVWHDKPFEYSVDVKAGERIDISAAWMPHSPE